MAGQYATERNLNNSASQHVSKMVLSKDGEWVYPAPREQQQRLQQQARQQNVWLQLQQQQQQQQHTRPIHADLVRQSPIQAFSIIYRALGKDNLGRTIGG